MKKTFNYKDGKFIIEFDFNEKHLRTLSIIKSNDGYVAFESRDITCEQDLDGNDISWNICDELVEMGLLKEDYSTYEVSYEISDDTQLAMNVIAMASKY